MATHNLEAFNDYQFTSIKSKKIIYRNYKFNKKAVVATKGSTPEDVSIREKNRVVQLDPEFFNPEDDVVVHGVQDGLPPLAPEYFQRITYLDETIRDNLAKLGYEQLTHVQRIIFPLITGPSVERRDVIICGRTGAGKSLAYIISAINNAVIENESIPLQHDTLQHNPCVLILAQGNNAAEQVYRWTKQIAPPSIHIGTAIGHFTRQTEFEKLNKNGADILIATIGRLSDYLSANPSLLKGIKLLVLDDAEVLMRDDDWIQGIKLIKGAIEQRCQVVCLSAGFDERSFNSFTTFCGEGFLFIDIAALNKVEKSVPQKVIDIARKNRTEETMKLLLEKSVNNRYPKAIVYCNSKEVATLLSHRLRLDVTLPDGFRPRVEYLHGGTFDAQSVYDAFRTDKGKRSDMDGDDSVEIDVVVACDGHAYGIDAKVELVINFDIPASLCIYAQRIGRIGRHGVKGEAYTLVNSETLRKLPKRCEDNVLNILHAAYVANAKLPDTLEILVEE